MACSQPLQASALASHQLLHVLHALDPNDPNTEIEAHPLHPHEPRNPEALTAPLNDPEALKPEVPKPLAGPQRAEGDRGGLQLRPRGEPWFAR